MDEENEVRETQNTGKTEESESKTESVALSRVEVLEASRKENRNGDEYETQVYKKGMQLAYSVGVLIISVFLIADAVLGDSIDPKIMMIYMGMSAAWSLYYAIKVRKKRPLMLATGIICTVAFAFFTVYWILKLCGAL